MDETNQAESQVHRVKRGRPPKAAEAPVVEIVEAAVEVTPPSVESPAQVLARRIWDGQGPDLNRDERIRRIAERLAEQGYTMEGIEL